MSPPDPGCLHVARAMVAEVVGEASPAAGLATTLEAVIARLHGRLDPWIGHDGSTRLFHRALILSAARHPGLASVVVRSEPRHLGGLEQLATLSPEAALAATHDFLGVVFEHLGRFVGHDVAVRLVLPETPELWRPIAPDDEPENR